MQGFLKSAFSIAVALCLVCIWIQPSATAATMTLFSDNFNSYDPNLQLAGQGGWVQDPNFTDPLMMSTTTPLGPTVAIDGLHRTGSSFAVVGHSLSGPLIPNGISIASVDAWAFSAYNSSVGGLLWGSADFQNGLEIYAYDPFGPPAWQVLLYVNGGAVYSDFIYGSFDETAHLELVVDGAAGLYFGRVTSASGVFMTPQHPISSSQIAQFTDVQLIEDFRSYYGGVDMDNVLVTTSTPAVPEPSSLTLFGVGLVGLGRVLVRKTAG